MSYNIDAIIVLDGSELTMLAANVVSLHAQLAEDHEMPESNVLHDKLAEAQRSTNETLVNLTSGEYLHWTGEGSGHLLDVLKERVVPMTRGRAELVLIWEGGDSITGAIIADGKWIDCDVEFSLVPKESSR